LLFLNIPHCHGQVAEANKEQATKHESAVDDFKRWNEEAVSRCVLFTPQVLGYSFILVLVNGGPSYFDEVGISSRQLYLQFVYNCHGSISGLH
jgi:hypothetical protein